MTTTPTSGLRTMARDAVRAQLAEVAIGMFAEHGFDEVTVEQIAAEAGISARSFHRYFPAKEDAVIGDTTAWAEAVRGALQQRPADEHPWESLRVAYRALLTQPGRDEGAAKRTMRVLNSTASLRARNLEKHLMWARLLTPVVAERIAKDSTGIRAQTLVQASLVCFDIALATWSQATDTTPASDYLDLAFASLNPA